MFCLEQGPAVYSILDTVLIYNMALHWCCGVFFSIFGKITPRDYVVCAGLAACWASSMLNVQASSCTECIEDPFFAHHHSFTHRLSLCGKPCVLAIYRDSRVLMFMQRPTLHMVHVAA